MSWLYDYDGMLSVPAMQTINYESNTERIIEGFKSAIENGLNPEDPTVQEYVIGDVDEFDRDRVQMTISEIWDMERNRRY